MHAVSIKFPVLRIVKWTQVRQALSFQQVEDH